MGRKSVGKLKCQQCLALAEKGLEFPFLEGFKNTLDKHLSKVTWEYLSPP